MRSFTLGLTFGLVAMASAQNFELPRLDVGGVQKNVRFGVDNVANAAGVEMGVEESHHDEQRRLTTNKSSKTGTTGGTKSSKATKSSKTAKSTKTSKGSKSEGTKSSKGRRM